MTVEMLGFGCGLEQQAIWRLVVVGSNPASARSYFYKEVEMEEMDGVGVFHGGIVMGPLDINADEAFASVLAEMLAEEEREMIESQRERWNAAIEQEMQRQEREAKRYRWVKAGELTARDVICEPRKGRGFVKITISRIQPPRSRLDRSVVVVTNQDKRWRYDYADEVMVLA